jgi:hypothetical protein
MAKGRQRKGSNRPKVKRAASGGKLVQSKPSTSLQPKTNAASIVVAMFKRTAARIAEIERRALSKLRNPGNRE